jgi:hypothetical protein
MKKNSNDIKSIVLSTVPYIIYVLVIIPLLGKITFGLYQGYALTSVKMTNTIVTLILILLNIGVILSLLYVFNMLTKFNMKKYLFVGGTVFLYTLLMAFYRYLVYAPVKIVSIETATQESMLKLKNYTTARGIFIAFAVYFIVSIFINRIAVISIKNKKNKSSH